MFHHVFYAFIKDCMGKVFDNFILLILFSIFLVLYKILPPVDHFFYIYP